jgi:diaminopimelate epimerase
MKDTTTPDSLPFMKMHGLGNDFVIIDSRGRSAVTTPALARALGDRHRGVGFDQLAEIRGEENALELDFWNADGSRAQSCGNATRCVAEFLMDEGSRKDLTLQTLRGTLHAVRVKGVVNVNMGQPRLEWHEVPLTHPIDTMHLPLKGDPVGVNMGNPHCVFFVKDVMGVDVERRGAKVENDPIFPERTNVEFAEVRGRDEIRMRVWERGTGVTLACGSGACATAVAANLRGLTPRKVKVELDGGWLTLDWRDDGVWMSGPTSYVFSGSLTPAFLASL